MENKINPALKNLAFLVGKWDMELSNTSFLPDPKTTVRGKASFEWIEGGNYLLMRQGVRKSGAPWATWLIGKDDDAKDFTILYNDDRGCSRVYQMSLAAGIWKMWRTAPKFTQRFEGKISRDKRTIKGNWEKSTDGKSWQHDFDIQYSRQA